MAPKGGVLALLCTACHTSASEPPGSHSLDYNGKRVGCGIKQTLVLKVLFTDLFLERGEGRKKEWERKTCVREKH